MSWRSVPCPDKAIRIAVTSVWNLNPPEALSLGIPDLAESWHVLLCETLITIGRILIGGN